MVHLVAGGRRARQVPGDLASPCWLTRLPLLSPRLCHQLLMTSPMPGAELGTACLNARAALLSSLQDGAFQNALMISQLLPVLNHKSYVDLISPDCLAPRGSHPSQGSLAVFNLQGAPGSLPGPARGGCLVPICRVSRGL